MDQRPGERSALPARRSPGAGKGHRGRYRGRPLDRIRYRGQLSHGSRARQRRRESAAALAGDSAGLRAPLNRAGALVLAVVLAGGKGTRLKPFTMTIPKPLLPLGDVPILDVVLRQLGASGVDHVILTLGHMAPLFRSHFGDGSSYGLRLEYLLESEPLGTAAPLRALRDPPEDFLVMNGDLLTDLSYSDLLASHRNSGAAGTISVAARQEKVDYGVVEMADDGAFVDYREKPVLPYHVSMGINVLSARALRHV